MEEPIPFQVLSRFLLRLLTERPLILLLEAYPLLLLHFLPLQRHGRET